ncbi:MAG TPA: SGNH/GDSL hydrolase family protein [Acidimicrobiia bacterium]|nr:SGNH/GDSL hydrolase family protein [Acidimicrobiia bacterium]
MSARRTIAGGCVALIVGLAVLVLPAVAPAAGAQESPRSYVALGDSYTAGPIIPLQETDPLGCLRSDHNYPHLVAAALGVAEFRDPSCSGAETDDMTAPQGVTPGPNPPQLDSLDAGTDLVTLGIGGNDIGFTEIAESCASPTPTGHPCQDRYVVDGRDELAERIEATAPKVAAVLDGIRERAPAARIFVVAYLAILPESGPGCWPQMPMTPEDVPYLRNVEKKLNAMLAHVAAAKGAEFVDAYAASVGHDACQLPAFRWVEPAIPASPAAPVHPNLFGMQGYAAAVLAQIDRHG